MGLKWIFIIFLQLPFFLWGQHFVQVADSGKFAVNFYGAGMYGSNEISSEARRSFFGLETGEFSWSSEIDQWNRLPRFGAYGIGDFQVNIPLNKPYFSHAFVKASSWNFMGFNTSKDMARLITIGNSSYRGKSLNPGGNSLTAFSSYSFGAGVIINNNLEIGLNFSILPNYYEGELLSSHFYTSDFGDSISFDAEGFVSLPDTIPTKYNSGWSLDLVYHTRVENAKGQTAPLSLYIRNLGLANIQANQRYFFDTTYNYNGITYNIPEDFDEGIAFSDFADSLGIEQNNNSYWRYLPFRIGVHKGVVDSSELKLRSYYGLDLIFSRSFMPLIYFGGQYQLNKSVSILGQLASGDVAYLKPGLGIKYESDKINCVLFSNNIIGAFSPLSYGADIRLSFSYRFP